MQFTLNTFTSLLQILKVVLDFLIVWVVVYYVLRIVRNNSRTVQIFKGIILLMFTYFVVSKINLPTTSQLIGLALQYGLLVFVVIFQPEIRSMLERLGKTSIFSALHSLSENQKEKLIDELVAAAETLSASKTGALITLEQGHSLSDYIKTGKVLNSVVTRELLTSIFVPSTPLHDGAVIIQGDRIAAASAYFPPTSQGLPTQLGARHRAAIGISEITDSITIVMSEETGKISVAQNGKLTEMDAQGLRDFLYLIIQNIEKEVSRSVNTRKSRKLDLSKLNIDPIKIEKAEFDDVTPNEKKSSERKDSSKLMKMFGVKTKTSNDEKQDSQKDDSKKEAAPRSSEETIKRIFKKEKVKDSSADDLSSSNSEGGSDDEV